MSEQKSYTRRCPICGKEVVERFRPFCSKRCADLDLGRWFKGSYAIASRETDAEEEPPASGEKTGEESPRKRNQA